MEDKRLSLNGGFAPGWQQRRSGVQFYFCCCPFALLLAPFLIVARLLGLPVASPWARARAAAQEMV